MSDNPYSAPNVGGTAPIMTGMPASLPGGVMVVAILCLLLGLMTFATGCCGSVFAGLVMIGSSYPDFMAEVEKQPPQVVDQFNQMLANINANPAIAIGSLALNFLLGLIMVLSSIGVLRRKDRSRRWLAGVCLITAIVSIVGLIWQVTSGQMNVENNPAFANMDPEQQQAMKDFGGVMLWVVFGFSVLITVFFLFVWRYLSNRNKRHYFS